MEAVYGSRGDLGPTRLPPSCCSNNCSTTILATLVIAILRYILSSGSLYSYRCCIARSASEPTAALLAVWLAVALLLSESTTSFESTTIGVLLLAGVLSTRSTTIFRTTPRLLVLIDYLQIHAVLYKILVLYNVLLNPTLY